MAAAAAAEQFELAARYRDLISTVHQLEEKQRIATAESDDVDVFGYHYEAACLAVNLFHIRSGKIVDRREMFWEELPEFLGDAAEADSEEELEAALMAASSGDAAPDTQTVFNAGQFFSALLKQLYIDQQYVPRTILAPVDFEDRESLAGLLAERSGHRVELAA